MICSFAVLMIGVIDILGYDFLILHDEILLQYEVLWYFSWNDFLDGSIKDKLIGVGPGLLDNVTKPQIANANFHVVWNYFYNTAHNELLEYLVTTGVVAMLLKLVICIIPFAMVWKREEYQAERVAIVAGLVGYIGQGLVTGPYVLMGMIVGYGRISR